MSQLNPCPFCGAGEDILEYCQTRNIVEYCTQAYIRCIFCGACGPKFTSSLIFERSDEELKKLAFREWNATRKYKIKPAELKDIEINNNG